MKKFTKEEDDFIRANYLTIPAYRISKELGRSKFGVYNRIKVLGLVIPADVIQKNKESSRFKKGTLPPNKGLSREQWMSKEAIEKMRSAEFRKGHTPHNHKPVGHERINDEGYCEIKVREPNVFRLKHRVIWEEANGPIPKDHLIRFKNKNPKDFRLENLEIVSKVQNMQDNTYHNYPPELAACIQLKGVLTRQINKRSK